MGLHGYVKRVAHNGRNAEVVISIDAATNGGIPSREALRQMIGQLARLDVSETQYKEPARPYRQPPFAAAS